MMRTECGNLDEGAIDTEGVLIDVNLCMEQKLLAQFPQCTLRRVPGSLCNTRFQSIIYRGETGSARC